MTPAQEGAALLIIAVPTDRALAGWQPAVWVDMNHGAVYTCPFNEMGLSGSYTRNWLRAQDDQ